jgi:peptide/nickel transport system ATP-binding protein
MLPPHNGTSGRVSVLLTVRGVTKVFEPSHSIGDRIAATLGVDGGSRAVRAVTDVSFELRRGETLSLVGESGCGKSTIGRIIAGIMAPTSGSVLLDGRPVISSGRKTTTRIQTVFQDPFASLNPRLRVGETIAEGPVSHGLTDRAGASRYVAGWLRRVGLDTDFVERYPHQFSGGQRQRVAIARALAMQPDILVCDEPVASLDVSIQAQIINLFLELRRELGLTMLFISHDLALVRHVSDRVAVMYLGRIVESGPRDDIYAAPKHPYTRALLESIPKLRLDSDTLVEFKPIAGELPSPLSPPPGCSFSPRCPLARPRCHAEMPELIAGTPEREWACWEVR